MAILLGALMERALKNFDPVQFAATACEQNNIPDDVLERAMESVAEFVEGVKPAWLDLKV